MADISELIVRVVGEGLSELEKNIKSLSDKVSDLEEENRRLSESNDDVSDSAGRASNAMGTLRGSLGNVGAQLQDVVVQLQGGTSAFTVIAQQVPQLLGSFGAIGAVVGTVVAIAAAIGGVLYASLENARLSTEELKKANDELNDVLQEGKAGAFEASDAYQKFALSGASAAEMSAKFYEAQNSLKDIVKDSTASVVEAAKALDDWFYGSAIGAEVSQKLGDTTISLSGYVGTLSDNLGITNQEASKLVPLLAAVQRKATPENVKALSDEISRLTERTNGENKALVELNTTLQNHQTTVREAEEKEKALSTVRAEATKRINEQNEALIRSVQIGNMAARDRARAQAEEEKKAFADREGVTKKQAEEFAKARDEEADKAIKRIDEQEQKKKDVEAKGAKSRSDAAAKRALAEQKRQETQAEAFLATIERTSGTEVERITATEQQKLAKLSEFQKQGLIVGQQFEDAKTDIQVAAEAARVDAIQKERDKQAQRDSKHDQFIAEIQSMDATEIEMIDAQQAKKEAKAKEFYAKGIINEEEYRAALEAIAADSDERRFDQYSKTLGDTTSALRNSLGEGNALYKAAAITQTTIDTYKAAQAAYASLAGIPIVGVGLGIAASAAAIASGLATVGKIRSAREQGGSLAAGQSSTIAERGKLEVITPASASRVRTAQQMRQIMGDSGSNSPTSVVIVNQTTGRIDSAQTEQDDEGRLRVIIREVVSSDMQDSNSSISKSRRATRGQAGF